MSFLISFTYFTSVLLVSVELMLDIIHEVGIFLNMQGYMTIAIFIVSESDFRLAAIVEETVNLILLFQTTKHKVNVVVLRIV